ncbi:MAG TPA: hypothetical protein VND93_21970 [Myxococcales bacterium]|nr:hypothetical protein [Myxococcales bacterium]
MSRVRWLLGVVLAGAMAGAGCASLKPPPGGAGQSLAGVKARLSARSGPALALAVDGAVAGRPAVIRIDLASALSRATAACFEGPPGSRGTVRFRRPWGAKAELPEAWLGDVELGGRHLGKWLVAVESTPSGAMGPACEVWLGTDALGPLAIEVDPPAGTVAFTASRPRSAYGREVIPLDRDPKTDRLLVPVRLRFGDVELAAPFILSTAEVRSTLGGAVAAAARLPDAEAYGPSLLELDQGSSLRWATLLTRHDWTSTAAAGELGADVWGRFKLRIDTGAQVLALARRTTIEAAGRPVCGTPEPSCFAVRAERSGQAWRVSFSAGRDLPEGAVVWLDLKGAPGASACRAAFSLWPADRGASLAVDLPSPGLGDAGCDADLQAATSIVPAAVDESGPEAACPGECLLLQRGDGDLTCQCSTFGTLRAPPARGPALLEQDLPPEQEPEDPR